MPIAKTSSKGQIVIPKEIRKKLGIIPGKKGLGTGERARERVWRIKESFLLSFSYYLKVIL